MKNLLYFFVTLLMITFVAHAQDEKAEEIGLDLNAVLELFSKSANMEDFEKQLNDKEKKVNNLDLNKDGNTDYLKIEESSQDKLHIIQLIAVLGEKDLQSVASIQLDQDAKGNVTVQIVGDSSIYGPNYIVEPVAEKKEESTSKQDVTVNTNTDASAIHDQGASSGSSSTTIVYVNSWPPVQVVYAPAYVVYVSPYHWGHYPVYWKPWPPYPPHVYHSHVVVYRKPYYHMAPYHRYPYANNMYYKNARVSHNYQQNNFSRNTTININNPGSNNVQKPVNTNINKPATSDVKKPTTTNTGTKPSTGKTRTGAGRGRR